MRNFIKGFFDGTNSSMRLVLVFPVFVVTTVWAIVSLRTMEVKDIPLGLGGFVLALVAGKVGQVAFEKAREAVSTTETSQVTTPAGATVSKTKLTESTPVAAPAPEDES